MLGIIGGTGLYQLDGMGAVTRKAVDTPYGPPSSEITLGEVNSARLAFLPRHGEHHSLLPSEVNYRANIYALKSIGVTEIISVTAVGSLIADMAPGDLALVNQYIDFTRGRRSASFFGDGLVAHISSAEPICPRLSERIFRRATDSAMGGVALHRGAVYGCVEGPRLGTRAESFMLKNAGCTLVGMTGVPEAFLAREAQICYASIAVVTDYDSWLEDPLEHVSLEKVLALYRKRLDTVKKLLLASLEGADGGSAMRECGCRSALREAVLTPTEKLSPSRRAQLEMLRA
jgi:5'-methylthioadenosine phosphorylase